MTVAPASAVDLYWLPLGAGGHFVARNGRACERLAAWRDRRQPAPLFHSALSVTVAGERFAIEMTPVLGNAVAERGVVATGAVGARWAGRSPLFRYEVRCWAGGRIGDVDAAVASPVRVSDDEQVARRIVELVPSVPTLTWGRDERSTGGMWNSNSLTSWLLVCAGLSIEHLAPPARGRAPGWHAGAWIAADGGAAPSSQPLR